MEPHNASYYHAIDGLLHHETDLTIEEHYTDTAGYTDQVFGLTHLLGFRFAPRLRDLSDSKLYSIGKASKLLILASMSKQRILLKQLLSINLIFLAMSAMLTTTLDMMSEAIKELERRELRDNVKIIIGGNPATHGFAQAIKADGYAVDVFKAVDLALQLV